MVGFVELVREFEVAPRQVYVASVDNAPPGRR